MNKGNFDLMGGGNAVGEVASRLQSNGSMDPASMRPYIAANGKAYISVFKGGDKTKPANYAAVQVNNGTLRPDEWKMLDTALVEVARERLTGFDYLVSKGLTWSLPNAMGTTVLEWQTISDSQRAVLTMDGVTRGTGDRVEYGQKFLPIPIMHVDYEINQRVLTVSRNMGNGLDVEEARNAARRIREMKEDMLFGNKPYNFGGSSIYSFLNFPDRTPVALALSWTDPAITPALILADVVKMKNAAKADLHFGPWVMFIPTNYESILDEDYDVSGSSLMTIRERLMKVSGLTDIVTIDRLAEDNVLWVQLTSDTVQIVNGSPLQNIQWKTEGNFVNKYKVIEIAVPRFRADHYGKSGVVHMS